jgi:hypothetical protein
MALARCILSKFLGVGCHFFPPPSDVPTFSAKCLHVQRRERPPAAEGGTLRRREMFGQIWPTIRIPHNSRDFLHAANLRHGTDGFTYPPKEGVLRIFLPLKIWRLRPGFNPRTWVPKASTLPLDHQSRLYHVISYIIISNKALRYIRDLYTYTGIYWNYLQFVGKNITHHKVSSENPQSSCSTLQSST